jgi:hypothetical protein
MSYQTVSHAVSPGTFAAIGARLFAGRLLEPGDTVGARRVAVINRHAAGLYFDDRRGLGRSLFLGDPVKPRRYTIVGIIENQPLAGLGAPTQPWDVVYVSAMQDAPESVEILLRPQPGQDVDALEAIGMGVVRSAGASVSTIRGEDEYHSTQSEAARWFGIAIGIAGAIVVLMSLAGTIASTAAWARGISWELALRRAVGARRLHVLAHVGRRAAAIAVGGAAAGISIYALVVSPELRRLLPHVELPETSAVALVVCLPAMLVTIAGTVVGLRISLRRSLSTTLGS